MPAGLLLSLTARPVRTGPGMEPSRRRCRRPQVPLSRWQERPAARLGSSRGNCPLLRHAPSIAGTAAARFPLIPARGVFLPRHPRQGGWGKGTTTGHPIPPRSRYGFPPLPGETRILPCPSHGSIAPGVFLRPVPPCHSLILPSVFPCPGLHRISTSVPLLSGQKIVRSTSIFPAIPAPLCKEK